MGRGIGHYSVIFIRKICDFILYIQEQCGLYLWYSRFAGLLLLWIYYSSVILYFGAEFTMSYAMLYGDPIKPAAYAVTIKEVEEEKGDMTVQEKENIPAATAAQNG